MVELDDFIATKEINLVEFMPTLHFDCIYPNNSFLTTKIDHRQGFGAILFCEVINDAYK